MALSKELKRNMTTPGRRKPAASDGPEIQLPPCEVYEEPAVSIPEPSGQLLPEDPVPASSDVPEWENPTQLPDTPPAKPEQLTIRLQDRPTRACVLRWNASEDATVRYIIVRKENGIPEHPFDGDILCDEWEQPEYTDKSLRKDHSYGYAVFACRCGISSEPATCELTKFRDLDTTQLRATADDSLCRLKWKLPENCLGVRILRSTNAFPAEQPGRNSLVVAEQAATGFEDTDVKNNTRYGYRLQCVYQFGSEIRYSAGRVLTLTPEEGPVTLSDVRVATENGVATVTWDSGSGPDHAVEIREIISGDPNPLLGQVFPLADLQKMLGKGQLLASASVQHAGCQFPVPENSCIQFAVMVTTGSRGSVAAALHASNIEKCEIDQQLSRMDDGRLLLKIRPWPRQLLRIHYSVAVKAGDRIPWATVEDAKNKRMSSVSVEQYARDGMILVRNLPKDKLYISVIGQYQMPDGSVYYSDASQIVLNNRPKQKIQYQLEWESVGIFRHRPVAKGCKLTVQCDASEIPELKLMYRSDGHIPMNIQDSSLVSIHTIPKDENGWPNGTYIFLFPDEIWGSIPSQTPLRLMLSQGDLAQYDLFCPNIQTLKVP